MGASSAIATGLITLSALLPAGASPPHEFRIFAAGWNDSRKGRVLFDAVAARDVMTAYAQHGTDLMLDLEHLSLDEDARNYDPDARAWGRLELRAGALWAIGVTWTPDGDRRVRERRQRYISPAFRINTTTRRVVEVVNVAITALPASDRLEPLIAANLAHRAQGRKQDVKLTDEDRQICRLTGRDPAEFLRFKQALPTATDEGGAVRLGDIAPPPDDRPLALSPTLSADLRGEAAKLGQKPEAVLETIVRAWMKDHGPTATTKLCRGLGY